MKKVKFSKAGKWADSDTLVAQIEVAEGDVVEVSNELADIIVDAGAGEIVKSKDKKEAAKSSPAAKDKEKAESK